MKEIRLTHPKFYKKNNCCGNTKSAEHRSCGSGCFEYPEDFH